jgi:hypothetical protein
MVTGYDSVRPLLRSLYIYIDGTYLCSNVCITRLSTLTQTTTFSSDDDIGAGEGISTREATPDLTGSHFVVDHISDHPVECNLRTQIQIALGVSSLRDVYLQALCSFMENRDVFVRTPRAGAKDMCRRLASIGKISHIRKGTTVIVSPYDVLDADRISELKFSGIDILLWIAGTAEVIRRLRSTDKPDVLCTTPEKLQDSSTLQNLLQEMFSAGYLARIVINDAHRLLTAEQHPRDAKVYSFCLLLHSADFSCPVQVS